MVYRLAGVLAVTGSLILGGCAQLRPDNAPFASDISELKMVMADDFTAVYARENLDLTRYTAVRVRPVQFWGNMEAFEAIEEDDKERLKARLTQALETALSEDLTLAEAAGPGVLDLQVRVTNLNANKAATNVLSTAVFKFSFDVGQAAMQSEFRDSLTNALLIAVQDEESGRRFLNQRNFLSKWGDVEAIFDGWAESLAAHVAKTKAMMETKASARERG